MAWGTGTWGTGSWGGAPVGFDVVAVWPSSAQRVRVRFSTRPAMGAIVDKAPLGLGMTSAYTLTAYQDRLITEPPTPPSILGVEQVTETDVELVLDAPLAGAAVRYVVAVSTEAQSAGGAPIGVRTGQFWGLSTRANSPVTLRSAGNPALVDIGADLGGGLQVTPSGDLALTDGAVTLKLRVGRRCLTRRNGFVWLPSFGLRPKQSSLIARSNVAELEASARAQIAQEPDIIDGTAHVRHFSGRGVLFVDIRGRLRQGGDFSTTVPVEL